MTHSRSIVLSIILALLVGCGDQSATLLYVKVLAHDGMTNPAALAVTFTQGGAAEAPRLLRGPGGGGIALPASFVIQADGRSGSVRVNLKALKAASLTPQNIIGAGESKANLTTDQRVDMTVLLAPYDKLVKTKVAPNAQYGRRPAVAGDRQGNSVVVWEDSSTSSGQTLFDIWFQLFGRKGNTTYKGAFLMTREHQPTVAMQQAGTARGSFVVAWVRQPGTANGKGTIYTRAMNAKGQPDTTPGAGKAMAQSASALASRPEITARWPSGYVVAWQEEDLTGGTHRVMARLLDDHGRQMISPNGQQSPFMLASFSKSSTQPAPTVAGDRSGGVMFVWNQGGDIKGSIFAKVGGSLKLVRGAFGIAKVPSGQASRPHVTALQYGYGVIWSDKCNLPPDTNGRCIRFRRFSADGQALASDYTLNTTTSQDQLEPRIASRTQDGSLLAVWTSKASTTADPQGGVQGRALLHNGLPVGADFTINTTTAGQQQAAAVAPLASDGFAVIFTDGASATPALRNRLVFPDYVGLAGKIGALCEGQNQCTSPSLFCQQTQAGKRCLNPCKGGSEAACISGGKCFTNKGLNASYCTYPTAP